MKQFTKLLFVFLVLAASYGTKAQEITITGTVTSSVDNTALPGVSVLIQGTNEGGQTDFDGKFEVDAQIGDVLVFSFVGMTTKSVQITDSSPINVVLDEDAQSLDEVIVTALGMKKEKKALTYSAQEVKGDELTRVKQTNVVNSLSGKSAGITVTRSSSGVGGASKVVLRGNSSTTNNDPLYVIDGVPMLNNGNGQDGDSGRGIFGGDAGNRDGGDAISLINPDDVESMTVLKGASAAALYGSQGANGVILITTKSGKEGKLTVNINSSFTVDNVTSLPKLQTEYQSNSVGQPISENGRVSDPKSWGTKADGLSNTVNDFFQTGYTAINAVSLSAGNKKAQTYFSYANTLSDGVMPENNMIRNNLNLRETINFLNDKLQVSASLNLTDQVIWNRPINGLYSNPLTGLYLNPVGIDLNDYKDKFEYFNSSTNMMDQYATSFDENIQQNPYWLINRNPGKDTAQRILANVSLNYDINEEFSITARGNFDKSYYTFDKRMYAGTDPNLAPATGRYILEKTENTQTYLDVIGKYNKQINDDFGISVLLGGSMTQYKIGDQLFLDSGIGTGLTYPNVFNIANFSDTKTIQQTVTNREVQSVFGSANLSFKNMLYLDVTGRSDWSSTLVNTDSESFFYPSIGLTWVLNETFDMPDWITFSKIRASYAEVGKDIPPYATIPLNTIPLGQNNFQKPQFGVIEGETLEPERQKSFEIGTDWKFFQNRLGIDITYYDTKTTNQIFFIQAEPNVQGFVQNIVNAGEITNKGVELTLYGKPIETENLVWNSAINYASNKNKVVSVHPSLDNGTAIINDLGVNGYGYALIEGEDFGSILGRSVVRDDSGTPVVTSDGSGGFTLESTDVETIAHAQPDFTLGWSNTFEFGDFVVNFLIDGKFGGNVVSVTEAVNDFYGVSQASADARNRNGGLVDVVDTNGNAQSMTAQDYFLQTGGRAGLLGEYTYDATNVSLRELSIGYNFNFEDKLLQNIRLSLIANNLFFLYKDAPFDPNIASSTGIGLQGVDIYGQPTTRSVGFNVNINF